MSDTIHILNTARAERATLQGRIDELDIVIKYIENSNKNKAEMTKQATVADKKYPPNSKTAQAGVLCAEYLKAGNKVKSSTEFRDYVRDKGIQISDPTLHNALVDADIKYNKASGYWEIKK